MMFDWVDTIAKDIQIYRGLLNETLEHKVEKGEKNDHVWRRSIIHLYVV